MAASMLGSLLRTVRQMVPSSASGQVRGYYVDWKMLRDVKRRKMAYEYADERLRINSLRKNTILPKDLQFLEYYYDKPRIEVGRMRHVDEDVFVTVPNLDFALGLHQLQFGLCQLQLHLPQLLLQGILLIIQFQPLLLPAYGCELQSALFAENVAAVFTSHHFTLKESKEITNIKQFHSIYHFLKQLGMIFI
uniref:Mitochondrial ribosomal protein S14 n=1 Tax=Canis lupus familiaris TaxID=9615 RepID=A0A8C0M2A6_CANLF